MALERLVDMTGAGLAMPPKAIGQVGGACGAASDFESPVGFLAARMLRRINLWC
jgi:hypothetical protein